MRRMKPLLALLLLSGAAQAQSVVYRCPGPPVLYTDAMTAKEAQEKGCKSIEGASVSVLQAPRPKAGPSPERRAEPGRDKVDPALQKSRDSDRRKVLESELRDAESKLEALKREYNGGEPERRGDERNFAKYQERVNELKAAITRQEADLQALRREIAKL
jgi:hypothetical protein